MSGTKQGARNFADKMKALYGDDYFKRIGALSAGKPRPGAGFASMSRERRSEVGRLGGNTRWKKRKEQDDENR